MGAPLANSLLMEFELKSFFEVFVGLYETIVIASFLVSWMNDISPGAFFLAL